jgi:hypothetical protein
MVGTAGGPDERYFFGVADRAEPGSGQGFQYDKLVRLILQDDASEDKVLSAPNITSASFERAAGSEIASTASSEFAFTSNGSDVLTSVRAVAVKAGAEHSRFLHNTLLKLGAFPIRRRRLRCFH